MPWANESMDATPADPPGDALGRLLRPGVPIPDWSVVTFENAKHALEAVFAVAGRGDSWTALDDDEDRILRAVLEGFAATARAPELRQIVAATGLAPKAAEAALGRLVARDLVVRDRSTGEVIAAYPLCAWPTGHRVRWGDAAVEALCAIDALGTGAMLGRDILIDAECRHCGAPIRVATRRQGREIASCSPERTVVWCGIVYAGNCGATSGCAHKLFLCSDEHLQLWRDGGTAAPGFRLSVDEAHQVGRAMFEPMLRPALEAATA